MNKFSKFLFTSAVALALVGGAYATTGQVNANLDYADIKITLNGNEIVPKDANGNPVEPFAIEGTTYLPVRAVANALGLDVAWNGETGTVELMSKTNEKQTPEASNALKTREIGQTFNIDGVAITLKKVSTSSGNSVYSPVAGKEYVICEFEVENNTENEITTNFLLGWEAYFDDNKTQTDLSAMAVGGMNGSQYLNGSIAAGKRLTGVIGYSAPVDWNVLEIEYKPDFWGESAVKFVAQHP